MNTSTHVCKHTNMYKVICPCVRLYIQTYIHSYAHIFTHIYDHTWMGIAEQADTHADHGCVV